MRKLPWRPSLRCLAVALVAAGSLPRMAPAQQPVTREQAVAAALSRGPRVALATPDTAAARAELATAREFQNPVISAATMVTRIVNMPQALSLRAFTTTMATLARVTTTMNSVVMEVVMPEKPPMLD